MDGKMGFNKFWGVNAVKSLIPVRRIYLQCCGLNVSLQNSYVEILIPKVMAIGSGAFGR